MVRTSSNWLPDTLTCSFVRSCGFQPASSYILPVINQTLCFLFVFETSTLILCKTASQVTLSVSQLMDVWQYKVVASVMYMYVLPPHNCTLLCNEITLQLESFVLSDDFLFVLYHHQFDFHFTWLCFIFSRKSVVSRSSFAPSCCLLFSLPLIL